MDNMAAPQDEELERMMNNKVLQQMMKQSEAAERPMEGGAISEDSGMRTLPYERGLGAGESMEKFEPIGELESPTLPPEALQLPVTPMPEVPSGPPGMWDAPLKGALLGSQLPSGLAGLIKGRAPLPMPKGLALQGILARAKGGLPVPPGSSAIGKSLGKLPTPPMLPGSKAITGPLSKLPGAGAMRKIPGLGKLFGRR